MIPQLLGYTLLRTIPTSVLSGVLTGAYQVCGGVIRSGNGQIVAHLVNGSGLLSFANPLTGLLSVATGAVNTYQIHKLGREIAKIQDGIAALQKATEGLMLLSKGTMVLSGLTLGVSAAGFIFLSRKINKIEQQLSELAVNVKDIKLFLESKERAQLTVALKTLSGITSETPVNTRTPLLVAARQTLGEIHERYREQFLTVEDYMRASVIEEYFSLTALAHARCAAELDMHDAMLRDLDDAYDVWQRQCRRVARRFVKGKEAEKLMTPKYASHVDADEIIDWMDFTTEENRGIDWIDSLRRQSVKPGFWDRKLDDEDKAAVSLLRKITSRDRIYIGYRAQAEVLATTKQRPSEIDQALSNLDDTNAVEGSFLFVRSDIPVS